MQFQVSFALIAMVVCFVAAAEEAKSASAKSVDTKSASDRSKRGLYAPLVTSPYAPAYAAPYAAPYTAPYAATYAAPYAAPYVAPYAAPYAAPYVASPYAVAPYTSSYVSSYGAYPYGYASPYGFYYKRLDVDWQQHQIICSRQSRLTVRYQINFLRFCSSNLTTHQKHEGYYGNAVVGRSRPVRRRSRSLLPRPSHRTSTRSLLRRPRTGPGQNPKLGQRCGTLGTRRRQLRVQLRRGTRVHRPHTGRPPSPSGRCLQGPAARRPVPGRPRRPVTSRLRTGQDLLLRSLTCTTTIEDDDDVKAHAQCLI